MPGYMAEVKLDPKKPAIARATLRTPGEWGDLSPEEKQIWSNATRAIDKLMDYYVPQDWKKS